MFTRTNNGINKTFNNVTAIQVLESNGKYVCHVNQVITTIYPSSRMSNDFSSGLFDDEEGKTYESTRHTLIKLPGELEIDAIQNQLDKFKEGNINRVLTNNINDILTDGDMWAINTGKTTLEDLESKYEVQDSNGVRYAQGKVNDGTYPKEFKRDFYNKTYIADEDKRENIAIEDDKEADVFADAKVTF